jgi:MFS transporter, ACS family, aldohexuronate transporter
VRTNRWFILSLFLLSSSINYLDRQVLAGVAPLLKQEFSLNNAEYGALATAFSIAYSIGAPLAGLMIDRIGLTPGISVAVIVWSFAGIATGLGSGLTSLIACRTVLGAAEGAGVPAVGKAVHLLLRPEERAIGQSLSQAFISLGVVIAPPLSIQIALHSGWRSAFLVTGTLGLIWIVLWRRIAPPETGSSAVHTFRGYNLLRDRRAWIFAGANALSMILYSLWSNWTVLYLNDAGGATLSQAGWFATLPPLCSTVGGLTGGWLSFRWMQRGTAAVPARMRVCFAASVIALSTAFIPWMPNLWLSVAGISLSFFAVAAFSVNMYTIPLDVFGAAHAAFSVSLLTASYGVMQAVVSPLFGWIIDQHGYAPICVGASITPLAAYAMLRWTSIE